MSRIASSYTGTCLGLSIFRLSMPLPVIRVASLRYNEDHEAAVGQFFREVREGGAFPRTRTPGQDHHVYRLYKLNPPNKLAPGRLFDVACVMPGAAGPGAWALRKVRSNFLSSGFVYHPAPITSSSEKMGQTEKGE